MNSTQKTVLYLVAFCVLIAWYSLALAQPGVDWDDPNGEELGPSSESMPWEMFVCVIAILAIGYIIWKRHEDKEIKKPHKWDGYPPGY